MAVIHCYVTQWWERKIPAEKLEYIVKVIFSNAFFYFCLPQLVPWTSLIITSSHTRYWIFFFTILLYSCSCINKVTKKVFTIQVWCLVKENCTTDNLLRFSGYEIPSCLGYNYITIVELNYYWSYGIKSGIIIFGHPYAMAN